MNKKRQGTLYLLLDYFSAIASWIIFYIFRKEVIEPEKYGHPVVLSFNDTFYFALVFIPIIWVVFYYFTGTYRDVFRKSRIQELGKTFWNVLIGCIVIFFLFILNDDIANYRNYYSSFLVLFALQFFITYFFRFIITTNTNLKIRHKKIGFNTLIIGGGETALKLYEEIEFGKKPTGNRFIGFTHNRQSEKYLLEKHLKHLGNFKDLIQIIEDEKVEEVIIAIEKSEQEELPQIIDKLYNSEAIIKAIPNTYDFINGMIKMTAILDTPLIIVNDDPMPPWQQSTKRAFDVVLSVLVMLIGSPIYILTAILVKTGSKGSIFYKQERIGQHGEPFYIYKFRSMVQDAENETPQLSSNNDPRVTKFGRFMRRSRLDEIPQFYNVLIGQMSLVGPRPERAFFIKQIEEKAPHYNYLLKVKPGITSWGQVRYGYAENVDQMVQRLKFDLLYIKNRSLMVDFRILIYTILIVLQGKGK